MCENPLIPHIHVHPILLQRTRPEKLCTCTAFERPVHSAFRRIDTSAELKEPIMEEYFPEVVAILEKNRKTRIPLKRTGALFLNTRPPKASGPADAPDTGGPGGGGMIGEEEPKETGRREPGDLLGEAKKGGGQKLESRNVMGLVSFFLPPLLE
uniref:Uncharacterized protein n=1 Tax=Chromera velia CCMP2878 TaxID=1169474 RepID=A0A0G4I8Z2_9ALVE|eukprot:Cvel_12024.t1-p1 / transcript=Cvel_12024.t1 / gene=Cvel_12024 / organism=Chromera_velia_CCMP2878 / gene_product=hypothetical protein / transcript_product=hypothetical protein / location=Cvel_scaffold772:17747-18504(+) / protein_length=153 / sequence_SO=supercontig / SO=protein_coding / is_pseudo=false